MLKLLLPVLVLTNLAACSTAPQKQQPMSFEKLQTCNVETSANVSHGVKVSGHTKVDCGKLITNQCITQYRSVPPNGEELMFRCPDDNGGFFEGSMITYW